MKKPNVMFKNSRNIFLQKHFRVTVAKPLKQLYDWQVTIARLTENGPF